MVDPNTGEETIHPLESSQEAMIMQGMEMNEKLDENNSLLEALIAQGENDNDALIEAQIVNDNQNTEKVVGAIKELKPELEKSASSTDRMVNFLEQMKGEDGHTPTEEELLALIEPRIPAPIKGDDGKTPTREELEEIIEPIVEEKMPTDEKLLELILPNIPPAIKPKDGIDGEDGHTPTKTELKALIKPLIPEAKNGSPDTGEEIVTKLEKLKGNKRLDKSAIKGLDKMQKEIDHIGAFGSSGQEYRVAGTKVSANSQSLNFVAGSNTTISGVPTSDGATITIASTGGGGAVDSVNGQTGVVVIDADDIDDTSTTNKFVTSSDLTKLSNLSGTNTGDVTVSDSAEIDFTLTGQQISASLVAGSIDETKLDASVNASLDLADTAVQPAGLSGYQLTSQKDSANGYAGLDAGGKINSAQLPDIALSTFLGNFTNTTTALADAGVQASQVGDWFTVDTSGGQSWIVTTSLPTTLADITQLKTPTDAVTSVFSRTGAVTAQNGDYTASNITNVPAGNIAAVTVQGAIDELDGDKQATLVSGTNIKTINSTTLLGSGDIAVATTAQGALADSALQGDGTAGYIPFYATADTLTSDSHFTYDSVNDVMHVHKIAGDATDGLLIESDNGTDIAVLGPANTANGTWYGNHNFEGGTLQIGKDATTLGKVKLYGNTSGDVTIQPNAVAGTGVVLTAPATTGTLALTSNITGTNSGTNTGDQTITNSSDATSHTVTLSASGGSVQFIEGSGITLTTGGTGSAGTVTIASSGGSGATTALDNLASVAINTSLVSDTDNTDDLGTTLKKWANLFVTTIGATGTRILKGWFTDIESTNIPTVGGTPVLSSLTAPQFTTIELGHASDTTLSRVSAGVVAVEGTNLVKAGATTTSGLTMATSRILGRTTASTGAIEEISVGTGLSLSGGTLSASGGSSGWALKAYQTASNTASITVSSLDMATNNGRYHIICEYDTTTGPEDTVIRCDINAVTTANSYLTVWNGRSFNNSAGTTADASGGVKEGRWEFGSTGYYCGSIVMDLSIHDVNGNGTKDYIGGVFHSFGLGNSSDTDNLNSITGSLSQRTQSNVTEIKFHNSTGDAKNWKVWVLYPAIA